MAVSDCSVTERRQWYLPYQTGKTVHVQTHYKHDKDGRMAPGARPWFCTAEPLGEHLYENLITLMDK